MESVIKKPIMNALQRLYSPTNSQTLNKWQPVRLSVLHCPSVDGVGTLAPLFRCCRRDNAAILTQRTQNSGKPKAVSLKWTQLNSTGATAMQKLKLIIILMQNIMRKYKIIYLCLPVVATAAATQVGGHNFKWAEPAAAATALAAAASATATAATSAAAAKNQLS